MFLRARACARAYTYIYACKHNYIKRVWFTIFKIYLFNHSASFVEATLSEKAGCRRCGTKERERKGRKGGGFLWDFARRKRVQYSFYTLGAFVRCRKVRNTDNVSTSFEKEVSSYLWNQTTPKGWLIRKFCLMHLKKHIPISIKMHTRPQLK